MAYRVELTNSAKAELEDLYLWVVGRAPMQGAAWFNGLERAIRSLEQHPKRCRIAPESFGPNQSVRVLNYGRRPHIYHVYFTVDEKVQVVSVVHIRRGARQSSDPGGLQGV